MQDHGRSLRAAASVCSQVAILVISVFLATIAGVAQNAAPAPNSDPIYQALRNSTLGGEAVTVSNFDLKRDAGTFHLHSGTVCFVAPVQGKVTGAVFAGDGVFVLDPGIPSERASLKLLTKEDEFSEKFEHMVMRFTDSTYEEIKAAGTPGGNCDGGLLKDSQNTTRHKLRWNLESRILEEVLSPAPRPYFVAFIHGKHYNDKEAYEIDPDVGRYQVDFSTYDENKKGDWASFSVSDSQTGNYGRPFHIEHQELETTLEKNANLLGKATTTFVATRNGLRVVPFDLFPHLRVQSVTADGQPLSFIQEDKNDDANFAVILPKPLATGERFMLTTVYGGKEAVRSEGAGNYFPVARDNWYPNEPGALLGEYASYDMTFRVPKGMKIVATGVLLSEKNEGGQNVSVWTSEGPQPVAGFSFGNFRVEQAKLTKPEYAIESYANDQPPDWVNAVKMGTGSDELPSMGSDTSGGALGTMGTVSLNKKSLAEGELAVQIYADFFGPSMFKHLQLTQQTACNFGQSWPELVWVPICYYFDTTVRHQLRLDWGDHGYWKVVTPHEVAHQWWGQTVGFAYRRDQWMSEGFADMSASLYISFVEKNPKKFIAFWNDERELLLERNAQGFRAIDVGPLTMGYRADSFRTGDVASRLIYPKGAYILHMLRMMMHDNRNGDQAFKDMMQDFVKTYSGKAATTEDFKAMVEKHMTREMDLDGNHKMDWFFNEYVYGTQIPTYKLDSSFDTGADGTILFNMKVTQSGVDDKFKMLVPIYLEMDDGRLFALGRAHVTGDTTVEEKVPLAGLKSKPKRAVLNYYDDVLATP